MADRLSLGRINDAIDRLCWQGIEEPPSPDDVIEHPTLESVEDSEVAQHAEIQEALDALKMQRTVKIENIGYDLMNKDTKIEQLELEIARLTLWKNQIKARKKWLKWYCLTEMVRAGIRHVAGEFIRITVCKNSQPSAKVPMHPHTKKPRWELIDPRFIGETVEPKLLKQDAIDHFNKTEEVPKGFTMITDAKHLRIR